MGRDFIIGCVGKPSAGKSTFFNAATQAGNAKVGNYPFTTIEPNQGIAHYATECPCKRYKVKCKPRYGWCEDGTRMIPVKLLDVAGLIPGASVGRGLGNKFLDDLRQADVLLHIIDVSGSTNEKGEVTTNYDASKDHEWLVEEVELWILDNLWSRWPNIARKHIATSSPIVLTFLHQFSGYGAKEETMQKVLNLLDIKDPVNLFKWEEEDALRFVKAFVKIRFRFILMLNKADMGADADKNARKISQKFDDSRVILGSALAECFLKKMVKQKYILYRSGDGSFIDYLADDPKAASLKAADEKVGQRLSKIKDLVLFRYGSTGIQAAINRAVEVAELFPVFPVTNISTFGADRVGEGAFPECHLVKRGITVREFGRSFNYEIEKHCHYVEGIDGRRLADGEVLKAENDANIIRFVTSAVEGKA